MKLRTLKATTVGAVVLSITLLGACKSKQTQKPPVPVKVAAVELNTASSEARYSATIIPRTEVELAFKVGGYVDAIKQVGGVDRKLRDLQEGDRITAGAVLAQVRQIDYQVKLTQAQFQAHETSSGIDTAKADYQQALSDIEKSKAQLVEAEAAHEKAKLDFERAQNLFASKSMTKADYDAAKEQFDVTTAKMAAARSQIRVLQAQADSKKSQIEVTKAKSSGAQAIVRETRIPLQDTSLKSPLTGVVLKKSIEKGTLVSAGTTGFVVADTSSVKVVFGVADMALPEMQLGRTLNVESETMPGREFRGQITSVFPAADPKSRVFNVEVTIQNPGYLLRPNMIVSLRVGTQPAMAAQPVVPLDAIMKSKNNPDGYSLFVVADEGGRQIARLRDVKLGESYGSTVAVTDGVKQGERVITSGGTIVTDGALVKVIP